MTQKLPIFASRRFNGIFMLLILQLACIVSVQAETLQKYREDVENIRADLTSLYSISEEDYGDGWTKKDQADADKAFYARLKELLPPKENVEWQGVTTEVDNRWLHNRLEELQKLPPDSKDRDKFVSELDARLLALSAKIKDLESQPPGTRNKDEEKQKLDQILRRPEYQASEKKEESAVQRWTRGVLDWLRDLLPKGREQVPQEIQTAESGISPVVVQALVILLVIAVLAFVIWRLAPLIMAGRLGKKEKKDKGERIILGEKLAADESSSTLFDQAEEMARAGNFRGAIRKGYIALLCELGDRRIVRIAQHKTNRDYLQDVRKNQELYGGVKDLTFMFESHWYGLITASEEEWSNFRDNYRRSTRGI